LKRDLLTILPKRIHSIRRSVSIGIKIKTIRKLKEPDFKIQSPHMRKIWGLCI